MPLVRLVTWDEAGAELLALRTRVFVHEQGVPLELEQDGRDPTAMHAVARDDAGHAVGTGRLLPSGQIGRMAVVAELRGQGIGSALLRVLLEAARTAGRSEVHLHAQLSARDFYLSFGFAVASAVYLEAGIEHVDMRAKL
jgi:predicted GNAT family N-acyltransferase